MGEKKKGQIEKQLNDEYISYLLRLFDNEDSRMNKLESKITQLIAQSGLIISIVTFILPLFYDSLKCIFLELKVVLALTFLVTILLLCTSIFYASKIFNIQKFKYADCSEETVRCGHKKVSEFKKEYIDDLIFSIDRNRGLNNTKGTILLKSNKLFAFGIYFLVALTIELLIVSFII
ncbi:hypothetical protein SAMN04488009_1859 [Maribacter sedimenticola]|uniref:Holin-X, holin superfamily III n=1 Tax=Maribacter sedimenticola TaxID=228956 RepID=A0ABY1SGE3_9FLAO|nr:hypothetical protein [Maribacter sedimenticola]SNR45454.1 hypothetical protein SAMN04488009_1859 [Maribacter sedimenticola]